MTNEASPAQVPALSEGLGPPLPERADDGELEEMADVVSRLTACKTNGDFMAVLAVYRYRLRTVAFAEATAAERERWQTRVEEAFREGYWSRETYNDKETSCADAQWARAKVWLLRA